MIKYRKAVVCPCCGDYVVQEGYTADFTTNEMIVCLDDFSQEVFHCKNCGATIYTGDMDDCVEYEDGYNENGEEIDEMVKEIDNGLFS